MRFKLLDFPILSFILLSCIFPKSWGQELKTWEELDRSLNRDLTRSKTWDLAWSEIKLYPSIQSLRTIGPRGLREGLAQIEHSSVRYFAYRILCKDFPTRKLEYALTYLVAGFAPYEYLLHAIGIVNEAQPDASNLEVITTVLAHRFDKTERLYLGTAVTKLPTNVLLAWVTQTPPGVVPASNRAMVLLQLLSRHAKSPSLQPKELRMVHEQLEELRLVPGYPRLVWLTLSGKRQEPREQIQALKLLVDDPSISDFEFSAAVPFLDPALVRRYLQDAGVAKTERVARRKEQLQKFLSSRE